MSRRLLAAPLLGCLCFSAVWARLEHVAAGARRLGKSDLGLESRATWRKEKLRLPRGCRPPPRPPIQAELPASLSSKPFQRKKDESLCSPDPASPISWLALGLPGSGRSTDPLSKLCSRSPQPRHRRASLGLGLRDKRVSKFPFGDFAISGSKTVKEDHNKIVKNNLMRKCTGILLATPGRPFPAPAPSPTPASATALW